MSLAECPSLWALISLPLPSRGWGKGSLTLSLGPQGGSDMGDCLEGIPFSGVLDQEAQTP